MGKGSVNHNSRKFTAEHVDEERTHLNIDYCNEEIQDVYHELFDDALRKYNEKQTRADRKIKNYYEKIRASSQEKPFHELILQIGNLENMSAEGEYAELSKTILDEYYQTFQTRNPNLRVFSAHLHMDEATPHLHIDFVPFTTGSKRGLETRVSLKQALAKQGFTGKGRGETEWKLWTESEKEELAAIMERHSVEWEHLGTHEQHLSVLEYKKQERTKEVEELDHQIEEKTYQAEFLSERVHFYEESNYELSELEQKMESEPEYILPEPARFMSAKAYKQKIVDPFVRKIKELFHFVLSRCCDAWDNYHRLDVANQNMSRENEKLSKANRKLSAENDTLRTENKNYQLLRNVFGKSRLEYLIEQAQKTRFPKQRESSVQKHREER